MAKKDQLKAMDMMMPMKSSLSIISKDVPEIKNWKVGKIYPLSIKKAKLTRLSMEGQGMIGYFEIV